MRKALKLMAVLAAFGLTAWIGVVALAQGSSAPTPSTATTTTGPTGGDDVKGNCDEAEHANDPECLGVNPVPEDNHENDDQGDVNDDDQGENEDRDQDENEDDDQGEDMTTTRATSTTTTRARTRATTIRARTTTIRARRPGRRRPGRQLRPRQRELGSRQLELRRRKLAPCDRASRRRPYLRVRSPFVRRLRP